MAYVAKDSAIPQNGGLPLPARCVDLRSAAEHFARCVSRTGRLVAYGTVPPLSSFMPIPGGGDSPQTPIAANNAGSILAQSELARQSVLAGSGVVPENQISSYAIRSSCPAVVPLSWIPSAVGSCSAVPRGEVLIPSQSIIMPLEFPAGLTPGGLAGPAPRWGDAFLVSAAAGAAPAGEGAAAELEGISCDGFMGWVKCNPWISVGLGLVGLALIGRRGR